MCIAKSHEDGANGGRSVGAYLGGLRLVLDALVVLLLSGFVALGGQAQVALPRIVEFPYYWHDPNTPGTFPTSLPLIQDVVDYPLEGVGGLQLQHWAFSQHPWAYPQNPPMMPNPYPDTQDIIDDSNYTLGTFIYYNPRDYPNNFDERELVTETQIPMGARMVIADELQWRYDVSASMHVDMSDECKEVAEDVLFLFSDINSPRYLPMCAAVESVLAAEGEGRTLADVFDAVMIMSFGAFIKSDDFQVNSLRSFADSKGIACSTWIYSSSSIESFRYLLRKAYYNLSAVHIFHRPQYMDWSGPSGVRQEVSKMLDPRFCIRLGSESIVLAFDGEGYAAATGNLYTGATSGQLSTTTDPEFVVRQGAVVVARVDEVGLYLKGQLYENRSGLDGTIASSAFRVKNDAGQTVAFINAEAFTDLNIDTNAIPAGSLILKNRLAALNYVHY